MNEAIIWAIIGAGIMAIVMSIKLLIIGKIGLDLIPATIFGFVCGGVGYWIISSIMSEIYPEFPVLAIVCLSFLGLGILGTGLTIIFRRESKLQN